ncbi:putative exocyst complex component Exo70, cullin repeat-like-containing domain superfamily [Helianthus annuus]|uniref:Exocyst subunit Exo70 family protein n=1 Tax=Helianthus annuus TaxID=4232 RepID=A0A251VMN9_HELAN|nr:exocyst complex component EXO70B1 [Helianthus annuus]KAF5821754.1 putative exocyst complex component Exo70, cullin repeat-like-containing domain superfamily [Helianthus annuus]KAJ0611365.1 putative exocyst complex component Exo70, cullin repeat-like-containing domain superfamily [Helianthus annuus]KAJ0622393.1 putative exocyst complex component Exo70, cullin repeat-like-containing domain superfamily [Helianthus annuus]KAJ0626665.1 putative exocyst complex component Exo70, cullin repeat-like-
MSENPEEKLIAVARHIAKTLGHTDNALTDDILQIFSNFDNRFREKLTGTLSVTETLDQTLKTIDRRVSRYLTVDEPIWSNSGDASLFLAVVDDLIAVIREGSVTADDSAVIVLDRAEDLLQQCMFRLEEEFKRLIQRGGVEFEFSDDVAGGDNGGCADSDSDEDNRFDDGFDDRSDEFNVPVAHPVTDYNVTIDSLPSSTINDLHQISQRMVTAGYGKECSLAYSNCRRDFIEESLSRLGFLGLQNVSKPLVDDDNDIEIEKWIKAVNMAVRVIYPSEQRLCDRVFGCSTSAAAAAADLSFMDTCRVSVMELLNFANGIAMGSRAPERLFKILDVYEAVKALLPEFEVLFSGHYCLFLKNEAVGVWKRLGESIRGIFVELENLIQRDPVKAAVPGGGLHPITRYVMNYLRAACSRPTLKQVFDDYVEQSSTSSSLSVQIAWIMDVLENNLESKSKAYRDPALSSVFMMNNGRYIVKKVKDDELGSLLGDDWIRKQTSGVRQHHVNYQRSSWHKILNTLKLDNNNSSSSSNLASKALKDKLKLFNSQFIEICRNQSTWVIFDEQLRDELKISVAGTLLPAYRNFLGRFHNLQDIGKYADKHVKFTIEDVEARIDGLFQATAVAGNGRK